MYSPYATEQPVELSTAVLMYLTWRASSAAKLCEIPGVMVPVAINRPPPTSSNVIGCAVAPSGCGSGARRLSPGNKGARIDGSSLGRFSAGESSLISAGGAVIGSG